MPALCLELPSGSYPASSALPFSEENVIFLKLVSGIAGRESLVDPACLGIQAVAKESGRSQKSTSTAREKQEKIHPP